MSEAHRPRTLVIAYDFPPHWAIGTMRTLRLVRRLVEDDWDMKVLTSDPRTFRPGTPVDDTLLGRVPASVTVVRAAAFRGFEALNGLVGRHSRPGRQAAAIHDTRQGAATRGVGRQALDLVDAALAIPDHESAWLVSAVTRGLCACRGWRPDVLYSSAPPWTGQLVARGLAALLRCPWVADFRDPLARCARARAVRAAPCRHALRHAQPAAAHTRHCKGDRARRARKRQGLLGPVSLPVDLAAESRRLDRKDVVELVPRVSRTESLREMVSASALLLVQPVTTVSVPGKAYEYLAAGRPLLALAEESETAELVCASGIGVSIQPDAGVEAIEAALLKVIEIASKPYQPPSSALYDDRVHATATANLLAQLGGSNGPGKRVGAVVSPAPAGVGAHVEEPRR